MKYVCEICGAEFNLLASATEHEKACKARHAKGLNIAAKLTKIVTQDADKAELVIALTADGKQYFVQGADYDGNRNRVMLRIV